MKVKEENNDAITLEAIIREKWIISIKKKVQAKLSDEFLSEEEAELLEEQLREDMEDVIKEELELFKQKMEQVTVVDEEDSNYDEGPEHQFYWGPEGEIIFVED